MRGPRTVLSLRGSPIVMSGLIASSPSLYASRSRSGSSTRVCSTHPCPQCISTCPNPMVRAYSSPTSPRTTVALLPPSSNWTRFTVAEADAMIRRPVAVEPVKVTMSTIGFEVSSSPTSPCPVMTLSTPGGIPASAATSAIIMASSGVQGWGLRTTVQPAASAGATFTTFSMKGKLNGVMAATTPIGSRTRAPPLIPVGAPVGRSFSTHGKECSAMAAFERSIPIDPAPCTASVRKPVEPVSAMISSRRSPARDSRISAIAVNASGAFRGLHVGPWALVEGPTGRLDGAHGGLRRCLRDGADDLLGGRVDDVDRSLRPFRGPRTVDEQLVVPGHFVVSVVGSMCFPCPTQPSAPDWRRSVLASQSCPNWRKISSACCPDSGVATLDRGEWVPSAGLRAGEVEDASGIVLRDLAGVVIGDLEEDVGQLLA